MVRSPQAELLPLFDSESAPMHLTDKPAILALAQIQIAPGLHTLPNRAFLAHQPAESPFSVSRVWDQAQLGSE